MTRRTAVIALLVLGAAALACGAATWFTATGSTALDPSVPVRVRGTDAAPAVGAAALVVVAGALALGLVGRIGRWVVLTVVGAGGAVVGASALAVARDPLPSVLAGAADTTGITRIVGGVAVGPVVWAAVVAGGAILLVAVWVAVSSRSWPTASARHEAVAARPQEPGDDRDVWDALSSGEDPT